MLKKTIITVAAVTFLTGVSTAKAETTFTFSSWIPWTHPLNTTLFMPWMAEVESQTKGRVKFRRLPKPVAHPRAHLDAVRTNQANAGMSVHGYSPKRFAAYLFAEHPFIGDRAEASSIALWRTHAKFLAKKNYYKGTQLIGVNTHGPGVIHHSKKHILSIGDMKGQKMRTGGPIPRAIVAAWGGVPIRQPAPKSYELLSTGVVDGITFPYESLPGFKITKLVPYSTYIPGGLYSSGMYMMISKKKYDSLSAGDRKIINGLSNEAYAKLAGKAWDTINDRGLATAKKAGNNIVTASDEIINAVRKLNVKFEADYMAASKKAGVDGGAVLAYFKGEMKKLTGK
ncbi:MAG: TRAP transporter substrate-binding protein [Rhodospirillales bacterium]|nr:TRAP transporter substrate-binding protein [Rhodospirillales bacterium]